jgi:hypothetical protein
MGRAIHPVVARTKSLIPARQKEVEALGRSQNAFARHARALGNLDRALRVPPFQPRRHQLLARDVFFLFVRKKILTLGQRGINQHQVDETRRQQRLSGHGTWSLQSKNSNSRIEKPAFQIHVRYAHGA